jgi:hypothetical protein
MSTKKRAAQCKIPQGRKPTAKQYQTAVAAVASPIPIMQPPHPMPPWGGPCFLQSYREAMAYQNAANKAAEYLQAVLEYNAAWQAMEDCLNGMPT